MDHPRGGESLNTEPYEELEAVIDQRYVSELSIGHDSNP